MELKKQVGIWIRVSTEDQAKGESPEHHEERARKYAELKNWNVVKVYRLDGLSGKSVMGYEVTKQMLKDLSKGTISGLIFSKLARLARNTKELLEFADIFKAHDADLISIGESIDTSSPAGRLFYTMIAAMAQWEREEITERVIASVPIRAKLGKPLGGQASFGYRWEEKQLVINETEAPVRKLMYELFLKHRRKYTVASMLNKQGHRTRNGSQFSDTTILRLLRDPTAKGQRIANYTKSLGDGKGWIAKPQEEWVIVSCPSIVSEEIWNQCNELLDEQEKSRQPLNKRALHLFTSILYCECGAKMYIPSQSKKYVCLACRKHRIDMTDLEEIYFENLKDFVLNKEQIVSFIQSANKKVEEKEQELKTLRTEKEKLIVEMDKLIALYKADQLPKEGFGNHYNPLFERAKQIDAYIPDIEAEIAFLRMEYLNTDQVVQDAISVYENWPSYAQEKKRAIIEEITQKITLSKDGITFRFKYSPVAPLKIATEPQSNFRDSSRR